MNQDLPTPSSKTMSDVKEFAPSHVNESMEEQRPREELEFENFEKKVIMT